MKKIKTDLKTTQKMLLELPHWVFIEKVDPKVNTLSAHDVFFGQEKSSISCYINNNQTFQKQHFFFS